MAHAEEEGLGPLVERRVLAGDGQIDRSDEKKGDHTREQDGQESTEQAELLDRCRIISGRLRERRILGMERRADHDVEDDHARQHEARHEGGGEERLDRGLGDQTEDDQDDGGRDHGAERADGADRADCQVLIIAQPQHLRQRNQTEQHHLAADNAGHRRHEHRHQRSDDGDAAAHPGKPEVERVIHLLGDAGALQEGRHEDKERDRNQHIFGHEVEDLLGQDIERSRTGVAGQQPAPKAHGVCQQCRLELHDHDDDRQYGRGEAQRHPDA